MANKFSHKTEIRLSDDEFALLKKLQTNEHFSTLASYMKFLVFRKISEVNNERG